MEAIMERTFFEATPSDARLSSVAFCDDLAREGRHGLGSYGFGYACPKRAGTLNAEYGFRTICTKGMGNHGTQVLTGRTPRARQLLRQGRAAVLVAAGCDRRVANAAAHMPRGMEEGVWRLACWLLSVVEETPVADHGGDGNSHWSFDAWSTEGGRRKAPPLAKDSAEGKTATVLSLTHPRKLSALAIAQAACGIRPRT